MTRLLSVPFLLCALTFALLPQPSFARGTALKGALITQQGQGIGSTGDCLCEWKWYTLGVNPGKLTVAARISTPRSALAAAWQVTMVVLHGDNVVTSKSVVCRTQRCSPLVQLKVNVHKKTIYYIRMEGFAASGIPYILKVTGPIVRLRCSKGKC